MRSFRWTDIVAELVRGEAVSRSKRGKRISAMLLGLVLTAMTHAVAESAAVLPRVVLIFSVDGGSTRALIAAFSEAMMQRGQRDGKTYRLELRFSGNAARTPALVHEVAAEKPAVMVVGGLGAARAARAATATVPVVMWTGGNIVDAGIVNSLSRPGGNVTGVSDLADEAAAKRLELLHAALPQARRVVLLVNPDLPAAAKIEMRVRATAMRLGIEVARLDAADRSALAAALDALAGLRADALLVGGDPLFNIAAPELIDRATAMRVPVIHYWQGTAERGALVSYEVDLLENFRLAATYVDRILRGANPGELPIYEPTRFDLVVNLKVAKVLGLTLPREFLIRANRLIE